jgi:hypothetical protein
MLKSFPQRFQSHQNATRIHPKKTHLSPKLHFLPYFFPQSTTTDLSIQKTNKTNAFKLIFTSGQHDLKHPFFNKLVNFGHLW